jgi:serine/threonine protein kinase
MSNSDRLSELLLEWEARRANNQHVEAAELCANSPELAAELQLQIDRIRMMEELLGETISGSSIETTNDAPPQSNMPTVEGYELQEVLDRGGMGVVYKAKQIELQRIVALKMMHEFHLSERRVARFRIEAEAVAKIQHTNIVQIFECGESDGRPWFSMEYVPGGSLGDFIKRGLPDPRETAELVLTLAIAVHATHEHGIVHRDLKPSNVLLTATGMPKLADFGLAKKLDAESEHTRTGEILGTPSYMAPEQAEGG